MFQKITRVVVVSLLTLVSSSLFAAQLVNINKADASTIAENLNGIGSAKAKAIVAYRVLHGDFKNADELIKVKGVGMKLVDRNKDLISFSGKPETPVSTPKLAGSTSINKATVQPVTKKDAKAALKESASN